MAYDYDRRTAGLTDQEYERFQKWDRDRWREMVRLRDKADLISKEIAEILQGVLTGAESAANVDDILEVTSAATRRMRALEAETSKIRARMKELETAKFF